MAKKRSVTEPSLTKFQWDPKTLSIKHIPTDTSSLHTRNTGNKATNTRAKLKPQQAKTSVTGEIRPQSTVLR